jgi:hypothetical protein
MARTVEGREIRTMDSLGGGRHSGRVQGQEMAAIGAGMSELMGREYRGPSAHARTVEGHRNCINGSLRGGRCSGRAQ